MTMVFKTLIFLKLFAMMDALFRMLSGMEPVAQLISGVIWVLTRTMT